MARVAFESVTKRFDDSVAVDRLDLEIVDGEFMVLVGPSGCGKTTALRCLAGLEQVTSGKVRIGDRVVNRVPSKNRNIAMVFQSYALYPHMTVAENLAFGLKLLKTPKAEIARRVESAAQVLDLSPLLGRKPGQLSGGQRQRVALGRAIVREPDVFLMDEPLSNLDAKLRAQTRAEILRLQHRLKTTTIYVTHDQVEAMTMGDRIAVMRDGVLQQVGTPKDLYGRPENSFVAAFIGSPAMNFATAQVEDGALVLEAGRCPLPSDTRLERGREVRVGFRPEHLTLGNGAQDAALRMPAQVDVVEYLGDQELIHAQARGTEIIAIVPSERELSTGERVELVIPYRKLHLFDPETERRLPG